MSDKKIKIRCAEAKDCEDILAWRNDSLTRSMSVDGSIISLTAHRVWFERSLISLSRNLYVGELGASKIGVCIFDFKADRTAAQVSINMNPESRGCGLGKRFLSISIERFLQHNRHHLLAEIKSENIASMKLFKFLGFRPISNKGGLFTLTRPFQELVFKEIGIEDTQVLFALLKRRAHSISNEKLPTREEHSAFVKAHPYQYWAIVMENGYAIGTIYVKKDNSIGINLLEPTMHRLTEVLRHIRENFIPIKEVKSVVPPYFYINVPHDNHKLRDLLFSLDVLPIQISYKI